MRQLIFLALLAACPLGGCAASITGGSVAALPEGGAAIDGIPYRMREQLAVEVYRLTDEGYVSVGRQTELLADPTRLYVLNFEGQALADASLKIDQRPDGSLSNVALSSTSRAAEAATNVATGLDSLVAAQKTLDELAQTEAAALEAEETAARAEAAAAGSAVTEAQLAALRTRDEVIRLELKLGEDRGTLKPSEVFAAESAIRVAKMQANTAAVAAGLAVPYPTLDE